jgi:hypothetical protein
MEAMWEDLEYDEIITEPGDVVLFDIRTFHKVGHGCKQPTLRSTVPRISIQMTFADRASPYLLALVHSEIANGGMSDYGNLQDYKSRFDTREGIAGMASANISYNFVKEACKLGQLVNPVLPVAKDPPECEESFLSEAFKLNGTSPLVIVGGNKRGGTTAIAKGLGYVTQLSVGIGQWGPLYHEACYSGRCNFTSTWQELLSSTEFGAAYRRNPIVHVPEFHQSQWKWGRCFFPDTKHVLVLRDPFDQIRSALDLLFPTTDVKRAREARLRMSVAELPFDYDRDLYYYNPIVPPVGAHLVGVVEGLAAHWNRLVDFLLENQGQVNKTIFTVRYEEFKQSKALTLARLAAQLGLKADAQMYTDRAERPEGQNRHLHPCKYFTPGEIILIWGIVHKHAMSIGYLNKPDC